jgi:hypothetical protein
MEKSQINKNGIEIEQLKNELLDGKAVVNFVKKNGEIRQMFCTRNWKIVAEKFDNYVEPSQEKKHKVTTNIVVWDIEKRDYRSIIPDSIQSYEIIKDNIVFAYDNKSHVII